MTKKIEHKLHNVKGKGENQGFGRNLDSQKVPNGNMVNIIKTHAKCLGHRTK